MKRVKKLALQAEQLSESLPKGTRVRYWPGSRREPASIGIVDSPFTVERGLTVVCNIKPITPNGPFGKTVFAVAASHIEKLSVSDAARIA